MPLKECYTYSVPAPQKFYVHTSRKNPLLVGLGESVLSINVISQFSIIRDGLHLRNVDGSSSAWEYHLPVQSFGNIFGYAISNEIYQQSTQHTVGHKTYKIEGKQYIYIKIFLLVCLVFIIL